MIIRMLLVGVAAVTVAPFVGSQDPSSSGVEVHDCIVRFADEVDVPVLASGPVAELHVAKNDIVATGMPIARLDAQELLILRREAMSQLTTAREDAADDLEIRYAELSLRNAEEELNTSRSIQNDVRGAVPLRQVRILKLAVERGQVELAQAKRKQARARADVELRQAELARIDYRISSLQAESPIGGVVLDVTRSRGEWIEQGQTIATVGHMDRLHIHALGNSRQIAPAQCVGLPVSVHWNHPATGKALSLRGKVLSVDPQMLPGGRYRLHAEIVNRTTDGANSQWLLQPGAEVSMKVYVSAATALNGPKSYRR